MSSVMGRQVRAFGSAVEDVRSSTTRYWSIQDLTLAGPMVVNLLTGLVEQRRLASALSGSEAAEIVDACSTLLAAMSEARTIICGASDSGIEVKGVEEYLEGMLTVRELLASLATEAASPKTSAIPTIKEFEHAARVLPPKQSWFEEDHRGLRGEANKD